MKREDMDIREILKFFPLEKPPVSLSEDSLSQFSTGNTPLTEEANAFLLSNWESGDEYTEFVPCFRINVSEKFHTLVYWKGGLLAYEYIIITISNKLELISKKVVAGTISNGSTVKTSVAHIDEEFYIYTITGETFTENNYNPNNSSAYSFMILPDGTIESNKEELFPK